MFEVKLHVNVPNHGGQGMVAHTFTIATFEQIAVSSRQYTPPSARSRAIAFAKLIDKGFGVTVQNVEDEDNREANFGLVYDRTPEV